MEFLSAFLASVIKYPTGSFVYAMGLFHLVWSLYLIFNKKFERSHIYRAYLLYVFFIMLWVISNAYFHSELILIFPSTVAKMMGIIATMVFMFSSLVFYYFSCLMKSGTKHISNFSSRLILFLGFINLAFNLYPNFTIKGVNIIDVGNFELIFGPGNSVIFLMGVMVVLLSFSNFISTIRHQIIKLENVRFFYIFFGMSLMYFSAVLFMVILPTFLGNYHYVWIPPLFSIADVLIAGYAVLRKRFLDIRLLISTIFKGILSFLAAYSLGYLFLRQVSDIYPKANFFYLHVFISILILILYFHLFNFLKSYTFHKYFGLSNTEFLQKVLNDLKQKEKVYTSIKELENDLIKAFKKGRSSNVCQIILINPKSKKQYPHLIDYFKRHRDILVTEEIKFVESEKETLFPFLEELESLGGVCAPLFHPSRGLIGFFALGDRQTKHLYTQNEINVLGDLKNYLSLLLAEILYSSDLKKQVEDKTLELKKKIKETNELVQQQSDFIAVTAHEFRTPLSIAMFQVEDILKSMRAGKLKKDDINTVQSSLLNLKDLTKKLFEVQQYDLKKVRIKKEKVEISSFIQEIYSNFSGLMQEKEMSFKLINQLKKEVHFNIDAPQLRQVLHNLLTNAYKFTPKRGQISLSVEGSPHSLLIKVIDNGKGVPPTMRKAIFNKFRTNSKGAGIGLGLYICQKIVELHSGKLWVEDTPKGGATFCIQL